MFLFQVLKLYSGSGKRDKYYLTMTSLFFHLFKRINKQFSVEKIGLLCPLAAVVCCNNVASHNRLSHRRQRSLGLVMRMSCFC